VSLLVGALLCVPMPSQAIGALLYTNALMGEPNQAGGASIHGGQFTGVRFQLPLGAMIDHVGGHLTGSGGGNGMIFAAIMRLSSSSDYPNSPSLSTSDVLGHTTFSPPFGSADIAVPIGPIAAPPGTYALVLGSGLFGATGFGALPTNNTVIGTPDLFQYQSPGPGWGELGPEPNRMTVYGVVPEPAGVCAVAIFLAMSIKRARNCTHEHLIEFPQFGRGL
jgi:hypothetical protein